MPRAWIIGGAAALAVLLLVSIVLGLTQKAAEFAEGTPERAVQRYLAAADDDDYEAAYNLLTNKMREECSIEDFAAGTAGGRGKIEGRRVTLEDTKEFGETAVVITRVTRISGRGAFGTSESPHEQRFTLKREEGEWKLSQRFSPFFGCGGPFPTKDDAPPAPLPTSTSTRAEMPAP